MILFIKNRNMKTIIILFITLSIFSFSSCTQKNSTSDMSKAKEEILNAEKQFAELCQKEGIEKAFISYADDNAKILLGDKVLSGKSEINSHYSNPKFKTATLQWAPDFVDVSTSCDMGYTYGKYTYTSIDSLGNPKESKGIFHTIWKKQPSGDWKFVWDN